MNKHREKLADFVWAEFMAYMSDDRHQGVSCLQSVDRRRGSDHNVNGFTIAAIQMGVSENGCTMVYPKMDGLQWKIMGKSYYK